MGESPEALSDSVKSREGNGLLAAIRHFAAVVCHPGPVPGTSGRDGQTSGIPRVEQCIAVNRPKQSRFPGECVKRGGLSFVSGQSLT